jgi:hypothetical protein
MTNRENSETKQGIIDEVSQSLGIGPFKVGNGSSEPSEFFVEVGKALNIDGLVGSSKPEIAQKIVERMGLIWADDCDSRNSNSGGGSTVTLAGLKTLRAAVFAFRSDSEQKQVVINVRPKTGSLRLFRSLTFKAWYALGEFIDNSITSAIIHKDALESTNSGNYELRVLISFDEVNNCLVIEDNAAGISPEDFDRALKTSEPPSDTSRGLSLHGVGMKAAGFWWGERISIETHPLNSNSGWKVSLDLDEFDKNSDETVTVLSIPHRGYSGTIVKVERLWNGVPKGRTLGAIRAFLPSIYRTFLTQSNVDELTTDLNSGHVQMSLSLNNQKLSYKPPQLLKEQFWSTTNGPLPNAPVIEWRSEIEVKLADGKVICGWVGILETMSRDLAGFTLEYRGKSIAGIAADGEEDAAGISLERGAYKPRRIFGQPGLYADQSIVGAFDLSAFGKSITTDSVTWTAEEEEEFVNEVYKIMRLPEKDFIAQATNLRRRKLSAKNIESENKAIERETSTFTFSLNEGGISHGEPVNLIGDSNAEDFDLPVPEEDSTLEPEQTYAIHDVEGHVHAISLKCLNNQSSDFLTLVEDSSSGHRVILNLGHSSISDLGPIEDRVRSLLIRIVLALCSAEIFLDGTSLERGRLRRKLNQVLDARGRFIRGEST